MSSETTKVGDVRTYVCRVTVVYWELGKNRRRTKAKECVQSEKTKGTLYAKKQSNMST